MILHKGIKKNRNARQRSIDGFHVTSLKSHEGVYSHQAFLSAQGRARFGNQRSKLAQNISTNEVCGNVAGDLNLELEKRRL